MITSEQLLNHQFSKAGMNGYKAAEVDELLTDVAQTIGAYEKSARDMQKKIDDLKQDGTIIQTTLVNAQRLATQLTDEAKAKAAAMLAEAQATIASLRSEAEAEIAVKTAASEKATKEMVESAKAQTDAMLAKAKRTADELSYEYKDKFAEQEALLAAMKNEVSTFRTKLLADYKKHLELIENLPNAVQDIKLTREEPQKAVKDDAPGSQLVQIFDEMKANETAAAEAVDEVAELTAEDEGQTASGSGFSVVIDED